MISLGLDYPISANRFWRTTVAKKLQRAIVYKTPEAEAWVKKAQYTAKLAGVREPLAGAVALRVVHFHRAVVQDGKNKGQKNGHVFDLDNVLKVTIDALKGIVYVDDRQIKRILVEYGMPTFRGGILVEVEPFVEPETIALFPSATPLPAVPF